MDIGPAAEPAGRASQAALDGRHKEAVHLYEEAVALSPEAAILRYNLGLEYAEIGEIDRALASLEYSVRLNGDDADALSELGKLQIDAGLLAAAEKTLDSALQKDPRHAPALNNRGVVHFLKEQYDEASQLFRAATEADGTLADAWFNLADACREIGDDAGYHKARRRFRELER